LSDHSLARDRESGRTGSVLHRVNCTNARSTSAVSASKVAVYASGRMRSTTSAGRSTGSSRCRVSSRSCRFRRFRFTAVCLNRGTTSPTRIRAPRECARGEAAIRTSIYVVRIRFPSRTTRCNSAPRVIRACRGKPSDAWAVLRPRVLVRDTDRELLPSLLAAAG
jgi:hypothetical protein